MSSKTFIAIECFSASKDRLNLLLEANAAVNFKFQAVLIYHSKNPRAFKNYAKSTFFLCSINGTSKPG